MESPWALPSSVRALFSGWLLKVAKWHPAAMGVMCFFVQSLENTRNILFDHKGLSLQPPWTKLDYVSTPRAITIARVMPSADSFIHQHLLSIYWVWGIFLSSVIASAWILLLETLREAEWAFPKWLRVVRTNPSRSHSQLGLGCTFFICMDWVKGDSSTMLGFWQEMEEAVDTGQQTVSTLLFLNRFILWITKRPKLIFPQICFPIAIALS